jgi:hypothetical protein
MIRNVATIVAAAALVGCFWWQGERFIAANGPTFDEAAHLAAGYVYWTTGDFGLNPEHPPLLKMLWALPLVLGDRPPFPHEVVAARPHDHWHIGNAFLYDSDRPPADLLTPSRRVNLAIGCGVVLLAAWWAYRVWGSRLAALAACSFAAFDPNLVALSCVLSTDTGLAFFGLLSAYLLWEYAAKPTRPRMFAVGASLGLLLATKMSALGMVAGLGTAGLVSVLRGGVLALPDAAPAADLRSRLRAAVDLAFRFAVIAFAVLAVTYGVVHFGEWGSGLKFQLTRAEHGDGVMYLNGETSRTGWYHYFLVLMPLKLPLGLLIACGMGILTSGGRKPPESGTHGSLWLLIPPLVFFAAASYSRVDLGIRVVLPVLPFLYVIAARLAGPGCCRCARVALLAGCVAWAGYSGWTAAPHQIAYFNELVAGPVDGLRHVADSNIDWGQGLPGLKRYMDRERVAVVYLSYFGTDRPEAYDIHYQHLPGYGRIGLPGGEPIPAEAPRHVLAVSANHLLGLYLKDPAAFDWLRGRPPTAILGGCIYIFDLTGDPDAVRRVRHLAGGSP